MGGFKDAIDLKVTGLPKGVTVTGTKIAKNKTKGQLTFKTVAAASIGVSQLRITATAIINAKPVTRRAVRTMSPGEPEIDQLALCVAIPTPFKFSAEFQTKYGARGGTFSGIGRKGIHERITTAGYSQLYIELTASTAPSGGGTVSKVIASLGIGVK